MWLLKYQAELLSPFWRWKTLSSEAGSSRAEIHTQACGLLCIPSIWEPYIITGHFSNNLLNGLQTLTIHSFISQQTGFEVGKPNLLRLSHLANYALWSLPIFLNGVKLGKKAEQQITKNEIRQFLWIIIYQERVSSANTT